MLRPGPKTGRLTCACEAVRSILRLWTDMGADLVVRGVAGVAGDVLVTLAQFAGQAVVAAAVTAEWEAVRGRFARLMGRGDVGRTEAAELWLARTREQLIEAGSRTALVKVQERAAERWAGRFADLLDESPGVEAALRALVEEVTARLPVGAVSVSDHSVAAGQDVDIAASNWGIAAGVIHGNVAPSTPCAAGFGAAVAAPGEWNLAAGSVAADRAGTAIGKLELERRPEAPSMPVWLAPRPASLVGREGLLAELDAKLACGDRPQVVTLCGLGGVGKTSVAVEYAYRLLATGEMCWQFSGEDPAVLTTEFAALAAQLGARDLADARDPVASVHAVLAASKTKWLVLFDNVVDHTMVRRFLPPWGDGRVVITSQSQHWPRGQALHVPVLDPESAAGFLAVRIGDADVSAAWDVAMELGCLPLALEQAAAYMQATGTALKRYLPLLRNRKADLLARGEVPEHPEHVASTFRLALSRLAASQAPAAGLLRLLAFLAPEPVPLNLLLAGGQRADLPGAAAMIEPLIGDPVAAGDAITELRRYSLLTVPGDGLVLVHRLVQTVIRAQFTEQEATEWRQAAEALVEAAVPADTTAATAWPTCALLLPHARVVLDLTSAAMQQIAESLGHGGSYATARDQFRLIAEALTESDSHGPDNPDTLDARSSLARWTGDSGDPKEARDQYAALLNIQKRALGLEHPHTLRTWSSFAYWSGEAGDLAAARDAFAVLLPVQERVIGVHHPDTLATRHNLVCWSVKAADVPVRRRRRDNLTTPYLPDALPSPADALRTPQLFGTVTTPRRPDTLTTRHNQFATLQADQFSIPFMPSAPLPGEASRPAGIRDQWAALLSVQEKVGPEHPRTLSIRNQLARWTGEAGDPVAARDQFANLLHDRQRVLGPDHPSTLSTHANLARWTGEAGDPAAARDQFAALLPVQERVLGPDHPRTLSTRHNLAHWSGEAGDPDAAHKQFAALLHDTERLLGRDHQESSAIRQGFIFWARKAEARGRQGRNPYPEVLRDPYPEVLRARKYLKVRRDRGEDIWPDDGISDEDYWASVAADLPPTGPVSPSDNRPSAASDAQPGEDGPPGPDARFGAKPRRGERGKNR
jgi:Tetratricopeptide repeat